MEVTGYILLLPQLFLHLLSIYIDLLCFLSLNQSFSCFLHLFAPFYPWSALFIFSIHFLYHCLHQNILRLSQNITISPYIICPCQLTCCFLQSQNIHQLHCIPLVHQLYTVHHPCHMSFCFFAK